MPTPTPFLEHLQQFLSGSIVMALLVIALFFLKFWRRTRERLFLYFAAAFVTLMIEQLIRTQPLAESTWAPYVYSLRLGAFALILLGIASKNRRF
jgi:hypothetical protein